MAPWRSSMAGSMASLDGSMASLDGSMASLDGSMAKGCVTMLRRHQASMARWLDGGPCGCQTEQRLDRY